MPSKFLPVGSFPSYALDPAVDRWALIILAVLVAIGAAYCVIQTIRTGSRLPLIILVASLTTVTLEPFFDVLGSVVHPSEGTTPGVTLLGREMPVYNALIYILYWSATIVYVVDLIEKGITLSKWLTLSAMLMVSALIFELIPIHFGMWRYYNTQPFEIAGFPLWWAFVNTHAAMGISAACYFLYRLLGPGRAWLIAPIYPGLLFGIHMFAAFPGYSAVSTTPDYGLALFGTGLAMAYSWIFIWLYGLAVCRDQAAVKA